MEPGPSVAAPAADGAGEEAASGRDGAAGEARAEEAPGPPAPAAPGGAERRSGEAEGEEERRERAALLEQHRGPAGERERLRPGERRPQAELGTDGPRLYGQRLLRLRERAAARRQSGEERQARAQAEWAVVSLGRRPGGREAAERIRARGRDKEQEAREAREENIRLKHEIRNPETTLKAQGERVEGQHLMDFEHMKKENQKHREKMDNLSDEILKLKKKVSNTVHILSQSREKLHFVEAENQSRRAELMDMETLLSQKREILSKTKQARDRLRRSNMKLQQKCGLLGNEMLLRDFEEKVDTVELLSQRLETLKRHHAGLVLTHRGIQEKIKEANYLFPC